jgi:uncharacterized protein YdeI (YjbR/CyaY-like superfamily)
METLFDLPIIMFETQESWEDWLDVHGAEPVGLWLKIAKKNSGVVSITYAEALESALCYGWIDGQKRSYDDRFFLQKFTPRRSKSIWSKINVDKVALLMKDDRMKPTGIAAVEAAQQDGRWDQAYAPSSTITVPADFQLELDKNPRAQQFFAGLNKTDRYPFLWRIATAKKPETRLARIGTFIRMLDSEEKFH